jgi:hypothetical protein
MGGFTGPSNPNLPTLPDIPTPDFAQQAQQTATGLSQGGFWDELWIKFWEHVSVGVVNAVQFGMSLIDDLAAVGMNVLTAGQGISTPGFYDLMAATIGDLLGIEIDSSAFQSAFQRTGRFGAVQAIGAAVMSKLITELAPTPPLTPATGLASAQSFLGYVSEFAVREGNVEFITQLLPEELRFFEGLRSYGTNLANGLGLGRLTREALRTMMKVLVSDPLTWYFNQTYRPTMLPVGSMIKAQWRGGMSADDVNQYLQWLGYRDQDMPQLFLDAQLLPSVNAFVAMNRTGFHDQDTLADRLTWAGIPKDSQQEYLDGIVAGRCEGYLNRTVERYLHLFENRWIDSDQCQTQLQNLGLSGVEIGFAMGSVAPSLEYASKELSMGEIEEAYINGLVGITYVSDWAHRQGYSQSDAQLLQYLILLRQTKETSAATIAAWRLRIACYAALAKHEPLPPGFDSQCNPTKGS